MGINLLPKQREFLEYIRDHKNKEMTYSDNLTVLRALDSYSKVIYGFDKMILNKLIETYNDEFLKYQKNKVR